MHILHHEKLQPSGVSLHLYDGWWCYCIFCETSSDFQLQEEVRPATELMQSLMGTQATLDVKIAASKVSLFTGTAALTQEEVQEKRYN